MANLKFADTHNMVAFLSKPEESDGFEQIVDFLNAQPIKYALTVNPTIYTSCIEQFWSTVKAKTINGEVQLHALVDVVQNQQELGEGSAIPTNPHHTPTITQPSTSQPQKTQKPRKPKRKDTQVPQPSGPIDIVADEAVHKELGDSLVRNYLVNVQDDACIRDILVLWIIQALAALKSVKPKVKRVVIKEPSIPVSAASALTKHKDLKSKDFDSIKELFDKAFKRVNMFVDFRTNLVEIEGSSVVQRGVGEMSWNKVSTKKQKVDDDKETTELKQCLEIIPDEEEVTIDAIPLAVKSPRIVDWKIHKEGKKSYYQIVRADGKSQMYMIFSHMLKSFDREDLEDLYKLVKARYGSTRPVEDLDLVLWNDLKNMFEPHVEDTVWRNQQAYKVLEWKLYDSCRVHFLRMQHMQIYMLVEKKYPLAPLTLSQMLEKKLQIDYESEMAYQLLLNAASITAALIDVNAAQSKLVLLENFNENYSKCLRLLYKVNAAEGVNAASEEVSTANRKQSHKPKSEDINQEKLYLLYIDLCGPMRVTSINGKKYILVIVDDCSRFTWVKFLASKDEAPDFIIKFLKMIQVRFNTPVRNIRTDNGTEFVNQILSARTMLIYANDPYFLGPRTVESLPIVNTKTNQLLRHPHEKKFYMRVLLTETDLSYLHVFGALCYLNNDIEDLGKLQAKADIVPITDAPRTVDLANSPVSTSINQDAPSTRSLSNVRPIHTPFESLGRWTKDHPIANVIVEPKNFKQEMTELSWIDAMQEKIHEFERLQVWELVLCLERVMLKWIYKVKTDEFGGVLKNKARLVAQGIRQEEGIGFE
ncbi:retrovirus-related pol polyprotein from transposon TNT 1-94 [Tanacetum coccineum]